MKKRILGILTVALALSMVFTMVSCGDGGGSSDGTKRYTVSFYNGIGAGNGSHIKDVTVDSGKSVPANDFPSIPTRSGFIAYEWVVSGGSTVVDENYKVTAAVNVVPNWVDASVVVSGPSEIVAGGNTQQYYADPTNVNWSIVETGKHSGTGIDNNGVLTVDEDETLTSVTVQATLQTDATKSGSKKVTVLPKGSAEPVVVTGVVVDPNTVSVDRGTSKAFTATVSGTGGTPSQAVRWSVSGNQDAGTVISVTGSLFVAAVETADTLTVKAASVANDSVSGTATVTVTGGTIFTVTFYLDSPVGSQQPYATVKVPEDTAMGAKFPAKPSREGYAFGGWFTAGNVQFSDETPISADTTLFAKWVEDKISEEKLNEADELLYLQNGGYAFYEFDIGDGKLSDFGSISVDYLISAAGLQVWNDNGLRGIRLYGVFLPDFEDIKTDTDAAEYGFENVKYININETAYNAPYILDQSNTGDNVKSSVTADEWFTVTYDLSGANKNGSYDAEHLPGTQTGKVYFALGIACQTTSKGQNRDAAFLQLVKDVTLVSKEGADVPGVKPEEYAQFLCYDDPIVFEWRAPATAENLANWRDLIPALPADLFDRGNPPDDLVEFVLGTNGENDILFTYVNDSNPSPNHQKGWVSFGEAGQANSQTVETDSMTPFNNFINAWYLVLETTAKPDGTVSLVWMGDANGWQQNEATTSSGGGVEGKSEIIENDDGTFTIKFFLPKALFPYGAYFNNNKGWAGLSLSYWGAAEGVFDVDDLGITKAYLLVSAAEVEPKVTSGVALGLKFTLGTAPAGGELIDDIEIAGTNLVVTTKSDLTDFRWYVNGQLKAGETGSSLEFAAASGTITVQAKRGGAWVSQSVLVTVGN